MFSRILKSYMFHLHKIKFKSLRSYSSANRYHQSYRTCVKVHPNIEKAIAEKSPVVALESAILTHGMKYPFNFHTALDIESVIRNEGAVPATIGLINGEIHVGLSEKQISFLCECKSNCIKVSRRDLPYALAKKLHGGTTVSGTMIIADMVGIPIFVTGGIGGVHRGAQTTMDVSADLTELGRTPITVVSAGVKSILDVEKTLEYLETQGVCVASLGPSAAFPDFFTRDSGFEAPCHLNSCEEAAQVMLWREKLNLDSGVLIAVPIPIHQEAEGQLIKNAIDEALLEAESRVKGRDITPFVLSRVAEITEGKSVLTNMDLIKNNAKHGARIAVEYSKLIGGNKIYEHHGKEDLEESQPVVIGGSIVDGTIKILEKDVKFNGGTHEGKFSHSFGGVGRNIADALTRLGLRPLFISGVGDDAEGLSLLRANPKLNLKGVLRSKECQTATYSVLLDQAGEALIGIGDMAIHDFISPQWVASFEKEISNCPIVVLDGNVPIETMATLLKICHQKKIPVWYEPTDIKKAIKPWDLPCSNRILFTSPNLNEFNAILANRSNGKATQCIYSQCNEEHLQIIVEESKNFLSNLKAIMITLGDKGFMIVRHCIEDEDSPLFKNSDYEEKECVGRTMGLYFESKNCNLISSVSGAGDCLAAGFIAGMIQGKRVSECAFIGKSCAMESLKSSEAVPNSIDPIFLSSAKSLQYKIIHT